MTDFFYMDLVVSFLRVSNKMIEVNKKPIKNHSEFRVTERKFFLMVGFKSMAWIFGLVFGPLLCSSCVCVLSIHKVCTLQTFLRGGDLIAYFEQKQKSPFLLIGENHLSLHRCLNMRTLHVLEAIILYLFR